MSLIVHQRTEVLHVTVVRPVHHRSLHHVEPGADGVGDDVLQDHHDHTSTRHLVANKLARPKREYQALNCNTSHYLQARI